MPGLTANLVLQTLILATGSGGPSYADAYHDTATTGRPLLVLVGADWCPACRAMKSSTMANMQRHGKLRQVAYAVVNTDHDQTLASQLMQGSSIPQLVLFRRTDRGWQRSRLIGAHSEEQIESFIGHTATLEVRHPVNAAAAIGAE